MISTPRCADKRKVHTANKVKTDQYLKSGQSASNRGFLYRNLALIIRGLSWVDYPYFDGFVGAEEEGCELGCWPSDNETY